MSTATPPASTGCLLVPGERFFTRTIPLDPEVDASSQVELALEGFSPFPLGQIYHGFLASPDKKHALVYAAFRRRFSSEETAGWADAGVVLPSFIACLAPPSATPALCVYADASRLTALAWSGVSTVPSLILTRAQDETTSLARELLLEELRARSGLPTAPAFTFDHIPVPKPSETEEVLAFAGTPGDTALVFTPAQLATMDVRDKEHLADLKKTARQARLYWRGLIGCAAALALAALLELGTWGAGLWIKYEQIRVQARASAVHAIENAQTLATRIDDLSGKRLRPLEMIAALNQKRPDGVTFLRSATNGLYTMEVEAQTKNAEDAGSYESALRTSGLYEHLEVRDLRSRDGLTTFVIVATFRPDALQEKGSS